jgi:hypothetical protein
MTNYVQNFRPAIALRLLGILAAGVILLGLINTFFQPQIMRAKVIRIWDAHMLAGTGGAYRAFPGYRWQTSTSTAVSTWLGATSWDLSLRPQHVLVADLGGRGGSGWTVSGGPVSRIDASAVRFELYGRAVERYIPGWIEGQLDPNETAYDFFLIRRQLDSGDSVILQQWVNVGRGESHRALGSMTHDLQNNAAHVQITTDGTVVVDQYYYSSGL